MRKLLHIETSNKGKTAFAKLADELGIEYFEDDTYDDGRTLNLRPGRTIFQRDGITVWQQGILYLHGVKDERKKLL